MGVMLAVPISWASACWPEAVIFRFRAFLSTEILYGTQYINKPRQSIALPVLVGLGVLEPCPSGTALTSPWTVCVAQLFLLLELLKSLLSGPRMSHRIGEGLMTKDRGMNEKYTRDFTYFVVLNEQSPRTTLNLVRSERIFLNRDSGCLGCCRPHYVGCMCFVYSEGSPGVTLNLLSDPEFFSSFWSLPFSTGGLAYTNTRPARNSAKT